jgi:hypothetical protein
MSGVGGRVVGVVLAGARANFRIILELWVYDHVSRDFVFGWNYGDEMRCAWNQIWFNATLISR